MDSAVIHKETIKVAPMHKRFASTFNTSKKEADTKQI